jgi:hypothetical protein
MITAKPRPDYRRTQSLSQATNWPMPATQRMAMKTLVDRAKEDFLSRLKFPLRITSVVFSLAVWWAAIEGGLRLWSLIVS